MTNKPHIALKIIIRHKIKSALRYCMTGNNRISELVCANNCERQYINTLVAQYLRAPQYGGITEVLSRADRTVIFFNSTGSQVTIR